MTHYGPPAKANVPFAKPGSAKEPGPPAAAIRAVPAEGLLLLYLRLAAHAVMIRAVLAEGFCSRAVLVAYRT
jgi:hypothetical protein